MNGRFLILIAAYGFIFSVSAEAAPIAPKLAAVEARNFQGDKPRLAQKSFTISTKAEAFTISYSSDVPLIISVSYPIQGFKKDIIELNPLDVIVVDDVPAGNSQSVTIDLTASPAWSPWRDEYTLHVNGKIGGSVIINDIAVMTPTLAGSVGAAIRQLFIDEAQLPSSINFLSGIRIWGKSLVMLLGIALLAASASIFTARNQNGRLFSVLFVVLAFVFLYDFRYSIDLVRANARDLSEWSSGGEYRQLGPLPLMSDFLREESKTARGMNVAMCFDTEDIVHKYLRYNLYPVPVRRAEDNWGGATHLVALSANDISHEDDFVACGDLSPREAEIIAKFPRGGVIYRFFD